MFEKLTNAAERLATGVAESRRGFLARFGKAALATAGAVVGLLALQKGAQAVCPLRKSVRFSPPNG
jgi:hypothetical protein